MTPRMTETQIIEETKRIDRLIKIAKEMLKKPKPETEMVCAECGEVDESYTAYCAKHGRSIHHLREKKAVGANDSSSTALRRGKSGDMSSEVVSSEPAKPTASHSCYAECPCHKEKEVAIIKATILSVLRWVEKTQGKDALNRCLEGEGFPTFVECVVFFTYRKKKPTIISTGWADQPRVYHFRKAWDELKLPPFERSCFHD